jgi:hypothetical protein
LFEHRRIVIATAAARYAGRNETNNRLVRLMTANVLVFGRRQRREARQTELAGVQKAPRHEVAGSWAPAGSECYGELMLAPISMMDGTPARRHLDVCTHARLGECSSHFGFR